MLKRVVLQVVLVVTVVILTTVLQPLAYLQGFAQGGCQTFPQTGKTVCGKFLTYWQTHGGLAQQGYPISSQFTEVSDLNGLPYTVQYFERAVFELHPENQPPYDVLLSQLGTFQFKRKYPYGEPAGQQPTPAPNPAPTSPPVTGPKLELINYTTYKPERGGRRAVGYARNTGSVDLSKVEIVATFKDASGRIVGTSSDDCTCVMRPNDFYPFNLGQSSSDPDFASVEFQLSFQPATDSDRSYFYSDFQVGNLNVVPPGRYDGLKVLGIVKNIGSATAELVQVHVLITDAAGKTIDVDSTFTTLDTLGPGVSSPFEVEFGHATQAPAVKVAVYAWRK
jgi:hypothetical protein